MNTTLSAVTSVVYYLRDGTREEVTLELGEAIINDMLHGYTAMTAPRGAVAFPYHATGSEIEPVTYFINPRIVTRKSLQDLFYPIELRDKLSELMEANGYEVMIKMGRRYVPYQKSEHKLIYTAF